MKPSHIFHVVVTLVYVPFQLVPESDSTGEALRSIAISQMCGTTTQLVNITTMLGPKKLERA